LQSATASNEKRGGMRDSTRPPASDTGRHGAKRSWLVGSVSSTKPKSGKRSAFRIRYHQTLRFFSRKRCRLRIPELYPYLFGEERWFSPQRQALTRWLSQSQVVHGRPRLVTMKRYIFLRIRMQWWRSNRFSTYRPSFKQPKAGWGNDNSPVAPQVRAIGETGYLGSERRERRVVKTLARFCRKIVAAGRGGIGG